MAMEAHMQDYLENCITHWCFCNLVLLYFCILFCLARIYASHTLWLWVEVRTRWATACNSYCSEEEKIIIPCYFFIKTRRPKKFLKIDITLRPWYYSSVAAGGFELAAISSTNRNFFRILILCTVLDSVACILVACYVSEGAWIVV